MTGYYLPDGIYLVRVLVGLLEAGMVILDDGVEQVGEEGVGLGVRGVHTDARVQVLNTCRNTQTSGTVKTTPVIQQRSNHQFSQCVMRYFLHDYYTIPLSILSFSDTRVPVML